MRKVFLLCLALSSTPLLAEPVRLCSADSFWYPFTFVSDGEAAGLHIDIIRKSLDNLGHTLEVTPVPWRRCLLMAEQGLVDGIAVASFTHERSGFLRYPDDAARAERSDWRVTQVEYVVVTHSTSDYHFEGDVHTLPQPVRAPQGYSIVQDLEARGVPVDSVAPGEIQNLQQLLRDRQGTVVTLSATVNAFVEQYDITDQFVIHPTPLTSKAYFLAFSARSALSRSEQQQIWDEIRHLRQDTELMMELATQY